MIPLNDIAADQDEIFANGPQCTITSPAGQIETFTVIQRDNHLQIDIGTGEVFTGHQVSVTVLRKELIAKGFEPYGVADNDAVPWLVTKADMNGAESTYKISSSAPSDGMGMATFFLEDYEPEVL